MASIGRPAERLAQPVDGVAEGRRVGQQRRDVLEQDARLGKVGNVADVVASGPSAPPSSRSHATTVIRLPRYRATGPHQTAHLPQAEQPFPRGSLLASRRMIPDSSARSADDCLMTLLPIATILPYPRRAWVGLVLALLAGCHAPPARPAACDGDAPAQALPRPADRRRHGGPRGLPPGADGLQPRDRARGVPPGGGGRPVLQANRPARSSPSRPASTRTARRSTPRRWRPSSGGSRGNELAPADIRLCVDGAEALAALDAVIDSAACRIDVLMYLWDSDPLGEAVAARLAARACAGVPRPRPGGRRGQPDRRPAQGGDRRRGQPRRLLAGQAAPRRGAADAQPRRPLRPPQARRRRRPARLERRPQLHPAVVLRVPRPVVHPGRPAGRRDGRRCSRTSGSARAAPRRPARCPPPPPLDAANASARLLRTRPIRRQLAEVLYRAVDQAPAPRLRREPLLQRPAPAHEAGPGPPARGRRARRADDPGRQREPRTAATR